MSLALHGARARTCTYDRSALVPAIVHLGVGGFHRAHQAVYLDDLAALGETGWGIVGVAPRRREIADDLNAQDGLFTVVERSADGDEARVVGSILRVLSGSDEPEAVIEALADPRTRVATLTITGGAYDVDSGSTVLGFLAEGLDRRRRRGLAPFTVLSCDNVPSNGDTAHSALVAFAEQRDPALAAWIDREVAFPNSMVDRITPETSDETRSLVAELFGIEDRAPVVTEPFSQWIIEDRFCNGRPPLEEVGVRFVDDVEPYELMKKRLLNGSHSALGYLGYLLGHRDTAEAMADPLVRAYVERLMSDEIAPLVPPVPGIDLDDYRETLLARFSNPKIGDQLARLCGRGSTKVPAYLLPSIVDARKLGRPHELLNLAVAAWVRYLGGIDYEGREIAIKDARLEELQPLAIEGGEDPEPLMVESHLFGWLADDPLLVRAVARILEAFETDGLQATVDAYLSADAGLAVS